MQQNSNSGSITCPLCQHTFNPVEENCHPGCLVGSHCHAVKCPKCSYEFVEHSSIVSFLRKVFRKKQLN